MVKSVKRSVLSLVLVAVFATGLALAANVSTPRAQAQDNTPITCDSTTILLLYLAQRDFGYTSSTLDLTRFSHGQFGSFFDQWSAQMGSGMSDQAGQTSGDQSGQAGQTSGDTSGQAGGAMATEAAGGAMATEAAGGAGDQAGTGGGAAGATTLSPASIAGEDPYCTQLRQEVETYVFNQLQMGAQSGMMGNAGQTSGDQSGQAGQTSGDTSGGTSGDTGAGATATEAASSGG